MARTAVIRTKAVREFPEQPQILELCKKFVSEMTPLFYEAANTGTMRADLALGDSGMSGLLHSLLVYNCDNDDERYRLKQDVRRSDEWSAFEIALAEAEKTPKAATSTGQNIDRLRKECGWSFDKLAEVTGIDKKQILSHVNKGTKPHPRILKEYAQAFSRELRRQITVADLEK
jgi:DNA-binding XRE family transcriptional regulator